MLLLAAGALAGCGGNSSGGETTYRVKSDTTMLPASPPISRSYFVTRMNRICRRTWKALVNSWRSYVKTQDPKLDRREKIPDAIEVSLLPGLDFYIYDWIHYLGAPRGQEGEIEAIIGPFQAAVELGKLGRGAQTLAEVPGDFATYNRRARRYGLRECLVSQAHVSRIDS